MGDRGQYKDEYHATRRVSDAKLYVTQFDGVPESELRAEFEQYGEIARMKVSQEDIWAFVEFRDIRDAEDAMLGILGKTFATGTKNLMVEFSRDCPRCQGPLPKDWVPAWRKYGMLGPKPEWMVAKEREMELDDHVSPGNAPRSNQSPARLGRRDRSRSPDYDVDRRAGENASKRHRYIESTLFVRNLPFGMPDEETNRHFASFGEMIDIQHLSFRDGPAAGKRRGVCYITYKTREMAELALARLDQSSLSGRTLTAAWRQPRPETGDRTGGRGYGQRDDRPAQKSDREQYGGSQRPGLHDADRKQSRQDRSFGNDWNDNDNRGYGGRPSQETDRYRSDSRRRDPRSSSAGWQDQGKYERPRADDWQHRKRDDDPPLEKRRNQSSGGGWDTRGPADDRSVDVPIKDTNDYAAGGGWDDPPPPAVPSRPPPPKQSREDNPQNEQSGGGWDTEPENTQDKPPSPTLEGKDGPNPTDKNKQAVATTSDIAPDTDGGGWGPPEERE